jgi:hypothetical protein
VTANSIFRGVSSFFHSLTELCTARRVALPAVPNAFFVAVPPWREIEAIFEPARAALFETSESISRRAFVWREAAPAGVFFFAAAFRAGLRAAAARERGFFAGADIGIVSLMSSSLIVRV